MNFFRDFFEQFSSRSESRVSTDIPQDILNDLFNDSLNNDRRKESDHSGRHDTFFHNPVDFMSEFEEMFNNFFKGFPIMAIPLPNEHEIPSLPKSEEMYDSNTTLQERMLNDKPSHGQSHNPKSPFPFSVEGFKRPGSDSQFNEPVTREDRNLDEDFKAGDKSLDDILPRGNVQAHPPSSFSVSGSFTSSSVTRDSNGVVESRKTVRDSRGNEEVTITRRIDGKEYTVTHKTDEHGNKQTREEVFEPSTEKPISDVDTRTPNRSPITKSSPWLYGRLRSWFFNED